MDDATIDRLREEAWATWEDEAGTARFHAEPPKADVAALPAFDWEAIEALRGAGPAIGWNGDRPRAVELHREALRVDEANELCKWLGGALRESLIDTVEAERHLALLGLEKVILCAYGASNRYVPERQGESYDWAAVPAERSAADWQQLRGYLNTVATPNLGFISCPGGTRVKPRDGRPPEIFEVGLLIYEIDGLPKDQQIGLWKTAGLPEPTCVMDTGGKSLHVTYKLTEAVPVDVGRAARVRLSLAIEAVLPEGCKTDGSMHSPHQPARLAGGIHPKTLQRSRLLDEHCSGNSYPLETLMALCPEMPVVEQTENTGTIWRADPDGCGTYALAWDANAHHLQGVEVPLTVALSDATVQEIKVGKPPGTGGRAVRAYSLSRTLQAAELQLQELGVPFSDSALRLFEQFVVASDLHDGDVELAFDKHWGTSDIGEGELSRFALVSRLNELEYQLWLSNPKPGSLVALARAFTRRAWAEIQKVKRAARRAAMCEAAKSRHDARKTRHLQKRMDVLERYIRMLVPTVRNSLRRTGMVREAVKALNLGTALKPPDLSRLVMEAQDERSGNSYRALSAAERRAMPRPQVDWLIPGAIPKRDLTIIGGRAKVGKTRLAMDVVRAVLTGNSFLDFGPPVEPTEVILVTDDQADGDSADMLDALGVYHHEKLLWSRRFRLTQKQLDALLKDIEARPGVLVVIDSLRSITRSSGTNENDPELGVLLYDLKQAVIDANGTLLLVHHGNKANECVGVEALSGHNSIPSAANTVFTVHYLPAAGGALRKDSPDRRLVREARSGVGADLVVTSDQSGRYRVVCSYSELLERQEAQEQEAAGTHALRTATNTVKDALLALLDRSRKGGDGVNVLQLQLAAGRCRSTVQVKRDLDPKELNDYKAIQRAMKKYGALGLVDEVQDLASFSGKGLLYQLSPAGVEAVEAELDG